MASVVSAKWEAYKTRHQAKSVNRKISKDIAHEKKMMKKERKSNLIPLDVFLTGRVDFLQNAIALVLLLGGGRLC